MEWAAQTRAVMESSSLLKRHVDVALRDMVWQWDSVGQADG